MQISTKDWKNYIAKLSKLNATAAEKMQQYIAKNGFADTEAIIDYAYGLVTKYGEGSAALSAQMFETVAEMEGAVIQPAVMAQTASRNEVAKMVNGIMKQTQNENVIANAVGRKVKQAGADTTLQNALRYGAEFAWIPAGDTCAFCIALASRGWQLASKKAIKNGHAEHIHSNCDCTYAIRFDSKTHIEGYDPKYYERMYYDAQDRAAEEGTFWRGKSDKDAINQMRRDKYKLNAEKIREQHRAAYAKRQSGGKTIGGHHYAENEYDIEKDKIAIRKYEQYARVDDSAIIAKNTGFSREEIQQVRSHVFFKKHDLERGYERLAPDYDMAVAWKRLQDGNYLPRDITLLNHELLESNYESAYNISQAEAHNMAQKQYNWFKQMMNETNQKGEADGLL